jgi:diguanylate cyclase (GGDEF)-like protein/PAS domain S-box-containing protein
LPHTIDKATGKQLIMQDALYYAVEWIIQAGYEILLFTAALTVVLLFRLRQQREMSQLIQDSPLAMLLINENSGELLHANRAAMQMLGIRQVGKRMVYPASVSPRQVLTLLNQFGGLSFRNHRYSWSVSEQHSLELALSGRKSQYHGRRVWVLYLVPYQKSQEETQLEQTSLKMAKVAMDALSELIFVKDSNDRLIGSNRAFNHFWQDRMEEGGVVIKGGMRGRRNERRWTTDPEGRSCLLETSQTMMMSEEGEVLGTLGISHDVTDWYKMQQDLRDEMDKRKGTEAELAQRDTILQSLLDSSPDAIGIFNENKVYQACNQAFASALGIDDYRDLIGHKAEEILPEEVYSRFAHADQQVINEGKSVRFVDHMFDDYGESWLDVVKSPYRDPTTGTRGVLLMARDVTQRHLAERKLEEMNEELEKLSFLDSLTTIANRRHFDDKLETFWNLHVRSQSPLTVLLVDIDYFKNFNDNYGHQQGDSALIEVAAAFQTVLTRSTDCVARYGGEEFAFILPETDAHGARVIANGVHQVIERLKIQHDYSEIGDTLTLSIGVATHTPQAGEKPSQIVSWADQALYLAKEQGRNRTCYYQ